MAQKKRFLLRVDPKLHAAIERWAADDLRSVNAQIEFLLRQAVHKAGRGEGRRSRPAPAANPPETEPKDAPGSED